MIDGQTDRLGERERDENDWLILKKLSCICLTMERLNCFLNDTLWVIMLYYKLTDKKIHGLLFTLH